jgi:hypothetical protein
MLRLLALFLALAALATGVAACGAEDVNPEAVAEAATKTAGVDGMAVDVDVKMVAAGQQIPLTMSGEVSAKGNRARLDLDMSGIAAVSGGQLKADQLHGEERLIGTTMYMRMPAFTKALGAEWIKLDLDKALSGSGVDVGQLQQLNSQSPAEQLKFLRATSDIEKAGTDEVDGVKTDHYKGTLRFREYPKLVPPSQREQASGRSPRSSRTARRSPRPSRCGSTAIR